MLEMCINEFQRVIDTICYFKCKINICILTLRNSLLHKRNQLRKDRSSKPKIFSRKCSLSPPKVGANWAPIADWAPIGCQLVADRAPREPETQGSGCPLVAVSMNLSVLPSPQDTGAKKTRQTATFLVSGEEGRA